MADGWKMPAPTVIVEGGKVLVYPPGSKNMPKPKPKPRAAAEKPEKPEKADGDAEKPGP